jgi:hypothetical protein
MADANYRTAWCSWCYRRTDQRTFERVLVGRNTFRCKGCQNLLTMCLVPQCTNGSRHRLDPDNFDFAGQTTLQRIVSSWSDLYCAEHDGSIADFERLDMLLDEIEEFHKLFENPKTNWAKFTAMGASIATIGALVAVTLGTGGGTSALAAALGKAGLLGTASTGTAITSLSGAALTSASLAALGGGTVAAGTVVVTAAGGALGGVIGGVLANGYAGELSDFCIAKHNEGGDRSVVFTNGFLSQTTDTCFDWKRGLRGRFDDANWYFVRWEASSKYEIGQYLSGAVGKEGVTAFAKRLAQAGSQQFGEALSSLPLASTVIGLSAHAWHVAMVKAMKTGALLADIIARAPEKRYVLMGHSLGARAIYYALLTLSTRSAAVVESAYLLGGAVDRTDNAGWNQAARALRPDGRIYNCYSQNDKILGLLYRAATAGLSDPIGIGAITAESSSIVNVDCTSFVGGHTEWKAKLADVFETVRTIDSA